MIVIMKVGIIFDKPIKLFDNWYESGWWADENINSDFVNHYFDNVGWFKILIYKLYLFF